MSRKKQQVLLCSNSRRLIKKATHNGRKVTRPILQITCHYQNFAKITDSLTISQISFLNMHHSNFIGGKLFKIFCTASFIILSLSSGVFASSTTLFAAPRHNKFFELDSTKSIISVPSSY